MPRPFVLLPLCLAALFFLAGCGSNLRYEYRYIPGKTAALNGGQATAPEAAPDRVRAAIAAANQIAGTPYAFGGGHGGPGDRGLDCSGATSYVLRAAGVLDSPTTSTAFRSYGRGGEGEWISVWARKGHVFLVLAGLRFDTGWHGEEEGPRWTMKSRPAPHSVIRHPSGL
jgi:hypothetical protein